MNLAERIEEVSEMGRVRSIIAMSVLINDVVEAAAFYFGLDRESVMKAVEAGIQNPPATHPKPNEPPESKNVL